METVISVKCGEDRRFNQEGKTMDGSSAVTSKGVHTVQLQNMAWLAYQGHVLKFELASGSQSSDDGNRSTALVSDSTKLKTVSHSFSLESRRFTKVAENETVIPALGVPKIVSVANIAEQRSGRALPCILMQSQISRQHFVNSVLFYVPDVQRCFVFGKFRSNIPFLAKTIWLLDGPVVCWIENGTVKYAMKNAAKNFYDVKTVQDERISICKDSSIKSCSVDSEGFLHIFVAAESNSGGNDNSERGTDENCYDTQWVHCNICMDESKRAMATPKHSRGNACEDTSFVPHAYASITQCMHSSISGMAPTSCDRRKRGKWTQSHRPAVSTPNLTYIATSMRQLLEFKNGQFCRLAWIPFDDAVRVVPMEMRGEKMTAVMSDGGQVCVVKGSTSKVVQKWDCVSSLHIDSFLNNGREQLLLLLDTRVSSTTTSFPDFILTDMDLQLITSDRLLPETEGRSKVVSGEPEEGSTPGGSRSAKCPKNLLTAVQALEMRVKHGQTSLKEQEMAQRQKEGMIHQSAWNLSKMAAGQSTQLSRQPTMIQLCGESSFQQPSATGSSQPSDDVTKGLKVTSGWQRVIEENWIIGLRVTNDNQWPITDLHLLVLPLATGPTSKPHQTDGPVQFPSSHISIPPKLDEDKETVTTTQCEPPPKRLKLASHTMKSTARDLRISPATLEPAQSVDVVAMTTIPEFENGPQVHYQLAVEWRSHFPSDAWREDGHCNSPYPEHQSVICGQVSVNAGDVIGDNLAISLPFETENSGEVLSREDELALDTFQSQTHLRVSSTYTQLTCLPSMLCQQMKFREMCTGEHTTFQRSLCCTAGTLKRVRVFFRELKSKSAQMMVCTKNKRELLLFYHSLVSHLPEDVHFSSHTPLEHMEHAITDSISHVAQELQHTHKFLQEAQGSPQTRTNPLADKGKYVTSVGARIKSDATLDNPDVEKLKGLRREFVRESSEGRQHELRRERVEAERISLLGARENTDKAMARLSEAIKTVSC
ncbi:uncharacterized protein [Diadema setosum]|uniref:uncharacterized protein n=1 Tax=Diadema setosum TaxID=31175 RepID=UPI003B3BA74E